MAVKTANLAIVFIDMKGYTARTATQTREEHVGMLRRFHSLVHTAVRAFRGTVLKGIGDAFLLTFHSPTDAALFGIAAQDYFWKHNRDIDPEKWLQVRVAINVGEVCLEGGDVFGDAVNIASRVESLGDAGDVLVTEAVYLAMNKAEVPTEAMGEYELKGVPMPVRVHRARKVSDGENEPPYGGRALSRVEALGQKDVAHQMGRTFQRLSARVHVPRRFRTVDFRALRARIQGIRIPRPGKTLAVVLGALVLVAGGIALLLVFQDPYREVRKVLKQNLPEQALSALAAHPEQMTPVWYALRGDALTRKRQYDEAAGAFGTALSLGLQSDDEPYLIPDALEGLDRQKADASRNLFEKQIGRQGIDALLQAASDHRYRLRWNAVETLQTLGAGDQIDFCQVYIQDLLHAESCSIRRKAAVKLAKIGDKRALEPLFEAQDRSKRHNVCMDSILEDAIRELNRKTSHGSSFSE